MRIALVFAMDDNGGIGHQGRLPWGRTMKRDLRRFRKLTMGKPVIMGRKTFESIGAPLKGRRNIIVTRQRTYSVAGACVVHTLQDALVLAEESVNGKEEVMVIGGAELYCAALPHVTRLYVTIVHGSFPADTHAPPVVWAEWTLVEHSRHGADHENDYPYTFLTYERAR